MSRNERVLVADNDHAVRWVLEKALSDEGYAVDTAVDGKDALDMASRNRYELVVMDVKMPVMDGITALKHIREINTPPEVIIITAHSSMENTVEAMKLGAFDHVVKPFDIDEVLSLARRAIIKFRNRENASSPPQPQHADSIIGNSPVMRDLYKVLGRVAPTSSSILITGETGTGKDLFARAMHHHSPRRNRPFITVNCASIPGELLESELFGHEKGSFTGAASLRIGKCELADGGTLFLDEIGAMRLDLQAKLLTFLQRSEFERVGSSRTIHVDVRVIAATNADLRDMTAKRLFREDLYFRLMVVPIHLPPLRERKEDISELARYFVDRYNAKYALSFKLTPELLAILESREWQGNIRELENYIHRLVILQSDGLEAPTGEPITVPAARILESLDEIIGELIDTGGGGLLDSIHALVEKPLLGKVLSLAGENQSEAAKRLGVSRNTLRKMMTKYGLLS
ncbi:MAG: sigma-54-dependent transcriptional regulator [Candidatus Latescibacterota bacterium]